MATREPARWLRHAQPADVAALRGHWILWQPTPGTLAHTLRLRLHSARQPWQSGLANVGETVYVGDSVTRLAVEGPREAVSGLGGLSLQVDACATERASAAWRRVNLLDRLGFAGTAGLSALADDAGFSSTGGLGVWMATLPGTGRWRLQVRWQWPPGSAEGAIETLRADGSIRRIGVSDASGVVALEVDLGPEDLLLRLALQNLPAAAPVAVHDLQWQALPPDVSPPSTRDRWRRLRRWARWHLNERDLVVMPGFPTATSPEHAGPAVLRVPLVPGWYFLRVEAQVHGSASSLQLLGLGGAAEIGRPPEQPRRLPVRPGRLAKRLLRVTQTAVLALAPAPNSPMPVLRRLSLVRVPPSFVRSRVERKLLAAHPRYAGRTAGQLHGQPIEALWSDYEAVFDRDPQALVDYATWIERVERPALQRCLAAADARKAATTRRWGVAMLPPSGALSGMDAGARMQHSVDSLHEQTLHGWLLEGTPALADAGASPAPLRWPISTGITLAAAAARTDVDAWLLLRAGDRLAPEALAMLDDGLQAAPAARAIYADDDQLDAQGRRCEPDFKPDTSPDLLLARDFVSSCLALETGLLREVLELGPLQPGAEAYDLALRVSELEPAMRHLPQVLCHRALSTTGADEDAAAARAVATALSRRGPPADTARVETLAPGLRRVRWPVPDPAPLVSLIVPTRDHLDVLRVCVESLLTRTDYAPFELLIVDNQSVEPSTLDYFRMVQRDPRVRVMPHDRPFNYAAINNEAAARARGRVLGLINNDIEAIEPEWLTEMVSLAMRPDIGCVGAKLLYPDDHLQHAGVYLGLSGLADHAGRGLPRASAGPQRRHWVTQELSAVTAAVLLVRREVFEAVGGLDADGLPVAFNDVDLCLKVQRAGWRNLWTPHAELYHHESYSRGADVSPAQRTRFLGECELMRARWGSQIERDPCYPQAFSRSGHGYGLALRGGDGPSSQGCG